MESNFWIRRVLEPKLLRVVEWAQKHGKKVEDLDSTDINEAMRNDSQIENEESK